MPPLGHYNSQNAPPIWQLRFTLPAAPSAFGFSRAAASVYRLRVGVLGMRVVGCLSGAAPGSSQPLLHT